MTGLWSVGKKHTHRPSTVEPPRTRVKEVYIPCYLCEDEVREGSRRYLDFSNLLELHPHRDCKVFRLLSHEFGVVQLYRTFSNYISSGDTRSAGCNMHRFGEVQAHRTSSNILELHPHRYSKVYRLLSHEFGVV